MPGSSGRLCTDQMPARRGLVIRPYDRRAAEEVGSTASPRQRQVPTSLTLTSKKHHILDSSNTASVLTGGRPQPASPTAQRLLCHPPCKQAHMVTLPQVQCPPCMAQDSRGDRCAVSLSLLLAGCAGGGASSVQHVAHSALGPANRGGGGQVHQPVGACSDGRGLMSTQSPVRSMLPGCGWP